MKMLWTRRRSTNPDESEEFQNRSPLGNVKSPFVELVTASAFPANQTTLICASLGILKNEPVEQDTL